MNGEYFTTLLEHARKIFIIIKLNKLLNVFFSDEKMIYETKQRYF